MLRLVAPGSRTHPEVEGGQNENRRLRMLCVDCLCGGDAVTAGHLDIHEDHVWLYLAGETDGGQSITALANHFEVGVGADNACETGSQ